MSEAQQIAKPEQHEFILKDFHTESGAVLPEARITYGIYGQLNAAKSNAILLPSHYMANLHGYEWLMGPVGAKDDPHPAPPGALDASKQCLIATELFGNGRSSSPSNTPKPFDGPRFPVMTIRDNVNAVHALLLSLGVTHVQGRDRLQHGRAAGAAVGGQLSHLHGSHRRHLRHGQDLRPRHRAAGRPDHAPSPPTAPSTAATTRPSPQRVCRRSAMVWAGWLYSQEWWRKELWRTQRQARHHVRAGGRSLPQRLHSRRGREQPHPAVPDLGIERRRPHAGHGRRRSKKRCARSRCRCSTCLQPPTFTSRSRTQSMRRSSSPAYSSCRSPRSGAIPPAPAPAPPTSCS